MPFVVMSTLGPDGSDLTDEKAAELLAYIREQERSTLITADLSGGAEKFPVPVYNHINYDKIYSNFKYATKNVYGRNQPDETRPTCSCAPGKCRAGSCSCLRASSIKIKDGEITNMDEIKSHPMNYLLVECSDSCGCEGKCSNKFSSPQVPIRCEIDYYEHKGFGVRIRSLGKKGSFFCEFVGEVVRGFERENIVYQFAIDSGCGEQSSYIDAKEKSNIARFINHSCNPCLTPFKFIREDRATMRLPQLGFFFDRDCIPGSEVTLSYGVEYWKSSKMYCRCFSGSCCKPPPEHQSEEMRAHVKKMERQGLKRAEKLAQEYRLCDIRRQAVKDGMSMEEALKIGVDPNKQKKQKVYLPMNSHPDGPLMGPKFEVIDLESSEEEESEDDDESEGDDEFEDDDQYDADDEDQAGPSNFYGDTMRIPSDELPGPSWAMYDQPGTSSAAQYEESAPPAKKYSPHGAAPSYDDPEPF